MFFLLKLSGFVGNEFTLTIRIHTPEENAKSLITHHLARDQTQIAVLKLGQISDPPTNIFHFTFHEIKMLS